MPKTPDMDVAHPQLQFEKKKSGTKVITYQAQDMLLSSVQTTAVGKWLKFIAQEGTKAPKRGVMRNNTAGSKFNLLRVALFSRTHYWAKIFETSAIDCILLGA